jgi:hypothetical protein
VDKIQAILVVKTNNELSCEALVKNLHQTMGIEEDSMFFR